MADSNGNGRGRLGLVAGGIALVATSSLVTMALVTTPAGQPLGSQLAAAVGSAAAPDGGGATPTPTDTGKGKGQPTPTPTGKGKGTPTPTPSGKGKGQPTPTPTGKGKGTPAPGEPAVTTLSTAQQTAGFRVRTLAGMPGATLVRVKTGTTTYDTAPGQPTENVVTLVYTVGQTSVSITETIDPLAAPAGGADAELFSAGGSQFMLLPGTGAVTSAETKAPDGVAIVVAFFISTPAGVTGTDRQTAHQIIEQLG
jgi:hypothetical protein